MAPTGAANSAMAETGRGARRTIPERPPKSGQTPRPNEYAGEYPTGRPVDGEASLVAALGADRRVVAPNTRFMINGIAAGISVTTARREPEPTGGGNTLARVQDPRAQSASTTATLSYTRPNQDEGRRLERWR